MSSTREGVSRRVSVPAMPAGSILKDSQKNKDEGEAMERKRRVSFERSVLTPSNLPNGSTRPLPNRRHSSIVPPSQAGLSPRPGHPLYSHSEVDGLLNASDLIEACMKDAEAVRVPEPLPGGSTHMAAALRDMLESDDNEENIRETKPTLNGMKSELEESRSTVKNGQKQFLTVPNHEKRQAQRRISAPVTKAPNINQLMRENKLSRFLKSRFN